MTFILYNIYGILCMGMCHDISYLSFLFLVFFFFADTPCIWSLSLMMNYPLVFYLSIDGTKANCSSTQLNSSCCNTCLLCFVCRGVWVLKPCGSFLSETINILRKLHQSNICGIPHKILPQSNEHSSLQWPHSIEL